MLSVPGRPHDTEGPLKVPMANLEPIYLAGGHPGPNSKPSWEQQLSTYPISQLMSYQPRIVSLQVCLVASELGG